MELIFLVKILSDPKKKYYLTPSIHLFSENACRVYYVLRHCACLWYLSEKMVLTYPSGDRLVLERNNVEVINQIYDFYRF